MRISVSKRTAYHADIYCSEAFAAKKVLRENMVSILALDFYLKGRENGIHLLDWAREKQLLPRFIVLTESDREKRTILSNALKARGFVSADNTTFVKH